MSNRVASRVNIKTATYAYLIVHRHGEVVQKCSFAIENAVDEKPSTMWKEIRDNMINIVMTPEDEQQLKHIASSATEEEEEEE